METAVDTQGNEEWNQSFGGNEGIDEGYSVLQTAAGGYIIAGILFWIICFNMSRNSQRLEKKYKSDR